jgi:hypothetical protein
MTVDEFEEKFLKLSLLDRYRIVCDMSPRELLIEACSMFEEEDEETKRCLAESVEEALSTPESTTYLQSVAADVDGDYECDHEGGNFNSGPNGSMICLDCNQRVL